MTKIIQDILADSNSGSWFFRSTLQLAITANNCNLVQTINELYRIRALLVDLDEQLACGSKELTAAMIQAKI